jgi:protein-L-isoaspartate O-methyltransferase
LNNQEYLIQILLKLRSIGIKNDRILGAIEKIPPHFYYNLLNPSNDIKKIDIDEVLEIAKLLQLSLKDNCKNENILLLGFKSGWLLLLLTNFCKRVYGICNSMAHKKKLEDFFLNNNYKNIYLCHGENILSWSKVAPFDLIFIFEKNDFSFADIISQLSCKGQGIIPSISENNKVSMIIINKESIKANQNCNCDLLINSDLI